MGRLATHCPATAQISDNEPVSTQKHWYRWHDTRNPIIDTDSFVQYKDLLKEIAESVSLKLPSMPPKLFGWNEFSAVFQEIAEKKIGLQIDGGHRRQNVLAMEDPEVKLLVEIRKLRVDENAAQTRSQKAAVRIELRGRHRELNIVLKRKGRKDLEKRVAEVEAVKNEGRKMFATLRALNIRSANELSIVDTDGRVVHTSETTSHDQWVADLLNAAVEGSIQLSALGTGTLVALQKPNKPRGPLTSLRTVVLLNGVHKVLSLILLERFSRYADTYIPASQAGFCKGQSCTDIIFAKWLLCSTTIMYDLDVHFLCLDLIKAFDTTTRDLILRSIQLATENHGDIMQIAATLLSNTKLSVCI